jgi:hypothetical protein
MIKKYNFSSMIELFPQKGGWHYVAVPKNISTPLLYLADRGLIAIHATVGKSTWSTSLLPMGDKTHFIALNTKVLKKEKLALGQKINISFILRQR